MVAPVTPRVPPTVALPVDPSVVNDPDAGVLPPIAVLSIVPPVIVAPDEEKLFAVVGPFNETAPVPVLNVPVPFCEKFCEAERLVKLPAAAVAAPIGVPLIEPPVIVAPDEARLFAVVRPFKLAAPATVSEPPKVVAPLPTDNVLVPVTLVGPFKETAPVPVESVVAPLWAKLAAKLRLPPTVSMVTSGVPLALVNSKALEVSTLGVNIAPGPVPLNLKVLTPWELVADDHLSEAS